jgi:predicted amidophosphoribosyltransferase
LPGTYLQHIKYNMSFLDALISKIVPRDCLACDVEGHLLCPACASRLAVVPERCYRCRKISRDGLTCADCRPTSQLYRVQVATVYDDSAKALIWQLKLAGTRAAARIMTERMALLLRQAATATIIVPVPTATSRVQLKSEPLRQKQGF